MAWHRPLVYGSRPCVPGAANRWAFRLFIGVGVGADTRELHMVVFHPPLQREQSIQCLQLEAAVIWISPATCLTIARE